MALWNTVGSMIEHVRMLVGSTRSFVPKDQSKGIGHHSQRDELGRTRQKVEAGVRSSVQFEAAD